MRDETNRLGDRFWSKVEKTDGCWNWIAGKNHYGYGTYFKPKPNGEKFSAQAHRLSYEELREPIPEGLVIDHLCRNPACVNPWHMEVVTRRVNNLRGNSHIAQHLRDGFCTEPGCKPCTNRRKTHCLRGHPLSGDNLYTYRNGYRGCRACMRLREREKRASV